MPLSSNHRVSPLMVKTLIALAVASSATARAADQYLISTAGLYDSTNDNNSHIGLNGISNNSISYFDSSGAAAGTAGRYLTNTSPGGNGYGSGVNTWYYDPTSHNTYTIGFTSAAYTLSSSSTTGFSPNGYQISSLRGMDNAGDVAGTSVQYLGNASVGTTPWIYTAPTAANPAGVTTAIRLSPTADGLVQYTEAPGSTNANGSAENVYSLTMNAAGQVAGLSARYDTLTYSQEGNSVFLYSHGTTINVGLTGAAYTGSDGETQVSTLAGLNANGQVVGTSENFSRGNNNDVFLYDPRTGTKAIGFTGLSPSDPNYANSGNYISSYTQLAPSLGAAAGYSTTANFTNVAWVYNFATGLTTAASLASTTPRNVNGAAYYDPGSSISAINNSGQAIGTQGLRSIDGGGSGAPGGSGLGQDAFFFDGANTTVIGLTDAAHTAIPASSFYYATHDVYIYTMRSDSAVYLNDAGQVAGVSYRYGVQFGSTTQLGQDAWYYAKGITPDANGNNAITIGLATSTAPGVTTSVYTNSFNTRTTSVIALNPAGLIAGNSTRYLSNTAVGGYDAYLYTPGGTSVPIGLHGDAVHSFSGSRGIIENDTVSFLNANGLAAGTSTRYTSTGATNGQDAWVYDSTTSTNYTINLSTTSTGMANATVQSLSDSGVLLGSYQKYNPANDALLGTYAYAFTEKTGAFDLGINTINLTSAGWQQLASTFSVDSRGDIAGVGTLSNGTSAIYILQHLLAGDANLDGRVDADDLKIVLNHLGVASSLRADGNFDGAATIDLNDVNVVLNNFGAVLAGNVVAGSAAEYVTVSATPEPATLGLLSMAGLLLLRRRRGERSR